jgi:predicted Zn-dependent protease with MMP-like domain
MLNLTEDKWNEIVDRVDQTICKAQDDLPEPVRSRALEIEVIVDKYQFPLDRWKGWKILGCYMAWTNGPIAIFAGQVYEDCHEDMDGTMASVRQIYYHELAHAIGDLGELEVKERGL